MYEDDFDDEDEILEEEKEGYEDDLYGINGFDEEQDEEDEEDFYESDDDEH